MTGKKRRRDSTTLATHMGITPLPNSSKQFRGITLKNGLTALLVSNPTPPGSYIQNAAVSMAVRAGSNLDPLDTQGLAHFVEHMVFLGSDKFPDEDALDAVLNEGGGDSNAITRGDHTVFHLDADPESLEKVLEIFSRFFIAPSMTYESIHREINSIDEEFKLLKQKDVERLKQLICYTSEDHHWPNRFTAGNKISLDSHHMDTLHKKAKAFFDDHYHGGAMKLCVMGKDSLSDLESWVTKYFGDVKAPPKRIPKINPPIPIWNSSNLHVLEGIEGINTIYLTWKLSSYNQEMPEVYLMEILRNETKESLYGFFKEKGWLTDLCVYIEGGHKDYRRGVRLFNLSMNLTDLGMKKKYEMIGYVCQYINVLRETSPLEWVWKEYWHMKRMKFNSLEISKLANQSSSPDKYAIRLSVNMLKYPLKHVVSGGYVPKNNQWNSKVIQDFIKEFTPKNMRIDLVANSLKHNADFKTEPWYGSRFTVEQIPAKLTDQRSSISVSEIMQRFPKQNRFVPTKGLNPRQYIIHKVSADPPVCIVEKSVMKMWYKCGENGATCAYFSLDMGVGDEKYSMKQVLIRNIFVWLMRDGLSSIMFEGKQAGLSNSISVSDEQLVFKVTGHREKFTTFVSEFWRDFKYLSPTMENFESVKEQLIRYLIDIDIEGQSQHLMSSMRYEGCCTVEEKLKILKDISFADLKSFISVLYSQTFIEALCYGDMLKKEALAISEILEKTFEEPTTPQVRNQKNYDCVKLQVPQFTRRDEEATQKYETCSLAKVYFQTGHPLLEACDERSSARLNLFFRIVNQKLFNQLRNKEQLGYSVECSTELDCGVYGLYISVTSSKHNPDFLLERIDSFLNDMKLVLENMSKKEFKSFKDSVGGYVVDTIDTQWDEIVSKRHMFNIKSREAKEVYHIKKGELIDWYKKLFTRKTSYRKFSVGIWGMDHLIGH